MDTPDLHAERERLLNAAAGEEFLTAVREELGAGSLATLEARIARLQDEHMYVAILGRQGVGKSSLINGLLFNTEVLPIDVDETTNVLCKVVHDQGRGASARVIFDDGAEEQGPANRAFLAGFVDEQQNPDNERKVREVIVAHPGAMLQSGIAFVDTPGVGSLTDRNQQVTMEFLPKVASAIFLFSTTPTLLKSEMEFLRATWAFSQNFFFVQNVWGEGQADIADAESDNLSKIRQLAREFGTDPAALRLFTVDVHRGLHGARNDDPQAYRQSGMAALAEAIRTYVDAGAGRLRLIDGLQSLGGAVGAIRRSVSVRLAELKDREHVSEVAFVRRVTDAQAEIREIESGWRTAVNEFDDGIRAVEREFDAALDRCLADAKQSLLSLVDDGQTDAGRVGQAIEEQVGLAVRKAIAVYERGFTSALKRLEVTYLEVRQRAGDVSFHFNPHLAVEAVGYTPAGQAAGGVLAYGAGAVASYIGLEAAFGIGSAIIGGGGMAGVATAAAAIPVAGLLIAGAVLLIGWGVRHHYKTEGARRLRAVIDSAVEGARPRVKEGAHKQYGDAAYEVKRLMDGDMQNELAEQRRTLSQVQQDHRLSREEAAQRTVILEARRAIADRMAAVLDQIAVEVAVWQTGR